MDRWNADERCQGFDLFVLQFLKTLYLDMFIIYTVFHRKEGIPYHVCVFPNDTYFHKKHVHVHHSYLFLFSMHSDLIMAIAKYTHML